MGKVSRFRRDARPLSIEDVLVSPELNCHHGPTATWAYEKRRSNGDALDRECIRHVPNNSGRSDTLRQRHTGNVGVGFE